MQNLLFLACPVGMGVMMWFMMKGQKQAPTPPQEIDPRSLDALRAERRRIDAELQRGEVGAPRSPMGTSDVTAPAA